MRRGGAGKPRGALQIVVDRRDRGEAGEGVGRGGRDDELARERELFAERVASGCDVARQDAQRLRRCRATASTGSG